MADYGSRTGGGASERKPEPPADKSFPADPRTRIPFAIALAALAGCADSIGFLEFSQLFMSFMSGNTTRFGVAVANGDWENVTRVASTISIFCFGAFLGTLIAAWVGRWRLAVLLTLQALLLAGGLLMPWGTFAYPLHAYPIVLALGLQNATLQDEGGRSLALTYVTGAVVRFGTGCANLLLGTVAPSFWIQAPLWAGLSTGAVVGGLLDIRYGESAFLFPGGAGRHPGPDRDRAHRRQARQHPRRGLLAGPRCQPEGRGHRRDPLTDHFGHPGQPSESRMLPRPCLIVARFFLAPMRRSCEPRVGFVGRRIGGGGLAASATRSTRRWRTSARLRSCVRCRCPLSTRTPSLVIRRPASRTRFALTRSSTDAEREHGPAELDRRLDLVDVLAARPGGAHEGQLDLVVGDGDPRCHPQGHGGLPAAVKRTGRARRPARGRRSGRYRSVAHAPYPGSCLPASARRRTAGSSQARPGEPVAGNAIAYAALVSRTTARTACAPTRRALSGGLGGRAARRARAWRPRLNASSSNAFTSRCRSTRLLPSNADATMSSR